LRVPLSTLGKHDLLTLLEVVDLSLSVDDHPSMISLLKLVSTQLPTDGVAAGLIPSSLWTSATDGISFALRSDATTLLGRMGSCTPPRDADLPVDYTRPQCGFVVTNLNNSGYSETWLKEYERNCYLFSDPTKSARMGGAAFVRWSETFRRTSVEAEKEYVFRAREHSIRDGVTVGSQTAFSGPVSTFSFIGKELEKSARDETILCYLAPYFHEAMCRTMPRIAFPLGAPKRPALSRREVEVLNWAMAGKTNWEISRILTISEPTVKFHVKNIMVKLHATSRAHAVAIALGFGLIRHTS
jgi:DNA-binding CsgD family transcriptional regulator